MTAAGKKIRIAALLSGGGTNLQAVIDGCESGSIDGEMVFVGSDNPMAGGLKRAEAHGISSFVVDYAAIIRRYRKNPGSVAVPDDADPAAIAAKSGLLKKDADAGKVRAFIMTRMAAEARLLEKMRAFPFDLLILAGFMRNLTPYFIDRVNTDTDLPRIMNIHPALLPAFPGTDGYGDTFRYGCRVGGCTVHFIDYGEDTGPIIGQKAFEIMEADTLETVRERGLKLEWQLYPECIQMFARNRLKTVRQTHVTQSGTTVHRTVVKRLGD